MSASTLRTVAAGLVAGAAATWAKTQAESLLQPPAERIWPPRSGEKSLPGADPADHPQNMPPSEVARDVAGVADRTLSDEQAVQAQQAIHWATGIAFGVGYALSARRWPALRAGYGAAGVPAGLALYAATHGSALPAAGLQPWPWRMPAAAVAWEAGSHAVYGAVLGVLTDAFDRLRT